ncbi:MAG: division/cell wall cluster transcriptional repressor MraZ [Pseudomonadota bacterium]|nr:division/cell wall cluster transcriptional repressor MraZ [Gammaproteobacteria bacterium]MBU1558470.1 division/cell wall cluster transcriptional repressor MraZ [Gammaproteobacteria bacterium]MBU1629239.1 division/cell wall cluster transcriptional repressor MraZ [Gammaproteobacteria bacterium]MBU1927188.1 division/cell wall cluster transcriptional repressor MraZ [Gammaproteobacteria bacterium]MBU2546174.1 division/cell wall cluster transcriptional repressor MraZ [Gammaproteobacteria bacterium
MFRGIQALNIDEKGRMAIPNRYRQQLLEEAHGEIIVTIDTEQPCLLMYPLPLWEEIEEKIAKLPSFHPVTRRVQRLLMGHAMEIEMDSHGRILLPAELRDYAAIEKTVMLVGQGKKFEIWDEALWKQSRDEWIGQGLGATEELPEELRELAL